MHRWILLSFILYSYGYTYSQGNTQYLRWVGDIPASVDADFKICHSESEVIQYFNTSKGFQYKGEKAAIEKSFEDMALPSSLNGMIRVRFIVNCKGEAGRFQLDGWDSEYAPLIINEATASGFIERLSQLNGWFPLTQRGQQVDYYLYLTFQITDGKIIEILP